MANKEQNAKSVIAAQPPKTQRIFKYVNITLVLILVYCIPDFLNFRQLSNHQGYHSFKLYSLRWSVVGFFCYFAVKYTYRYLMQTRIQSIIHPKYQGAQREYKTKAVLKLSFDTIFYSLTTIFGYCLFRTEYWFPSMLGGQGSCKAIHSQYPNWPTKSIANLQIYYMVQLGVHAFSVFQMVIMRRGTERKYHEFLLHHCVAVCLIVLSMLAHETAAGAVVLITHDLSDILAAFGRGFVETKYQIKWANISLYIVMTSVWIYTRHVVFPFCLIASTLRTAPIPTDEWYVICFGVYYICALMIVLEFMHMFWTYYLLKIGIGNTWKKMPNLHDEKDLKKLQ